MDNFISDKILCDVNKVLICMPFQVLLNVTNMAVDCLYKAYPCWPARNMAGLILPTVRGA
jgi:hypothetical protein